MKQVGLFVAQVYYQDYGHSLCLMGDQVSRYLGSSKILKDCLEEISCLVELASDLVMAE